MIEKGSFFKKLFGRKKKSDCCNMEIVNEDNKKSNCCDIDIVEEEEKKEPFVCNCAGRCTTPDKSKL